MKKLSRNEWIAVVITLVVIVLIFGAGLLLNNKPTLTMNNENNNATDTDVAATTTSEGNAPVTLADGLVIQDEVVGTGATAVAGDNITVNYVGTLQDGTKFDSSIDRGVPFPFTLGAGQVIPGWDEGVAGMKVGGTRLLSIPPALAYGAQGVPGTIPANATLIFQVQLLSIKGK